MNNPFESIEARLSNIENLLLDIKHSPPPQNNFPETDRWFDIVELCNYLPDKPSVPTAYGWVHFKTVPYHKSPGQKKLRFLKSEIDEWLNMGRKKTLAEKASEADTYINKKGLNNGK
jgi:predicted DNA-binding transcriptional regulator AlpA